MLCCLCLSRRKSLKHPCLPFCVVMLLYVVICKDVVVLDCVEFSRCWLGCCNFRQFTYKFQTVCLCTLTGLRRSVCFVSPDKACLSGFCFFLLQKSQKDRNICEFLPIVKHFWNSENKSFFKRRHSWHVSNKNYFNNIYTLKLVFLKAFYKFKSLINFYSVIKCTTKSESEFIKMPLKTGYC